MEERIGRKNINIKIKWSEEESEAGRFWAVEASGMGMSCMLLEVVLVVGGVVGSVAVEVGSVVAGIVEDSGVAGVEDEVGASGGVVEGGESTIVKKFEELG